MPTPFDALPFEEEILKEKRKKFSRKKSPLQASSLTTYLRAQHCLRVDRALRLQRTEEELATVGREKEETLKKIEDIKKRIEERRAEKKKQQEERGEKRLAESEKDKERE